MTEVFRTDNPLLYTELEGVIVTEKNPPPAVVSAGTNNAVLIAQFERGPANEPTPISSISELQSQFGNNNAFGGNKALRFKRWSNLYVTRVTAAAAVKATWTQVSNTNNTITVTAKYTGAYGNDIEVTIATGTEIGSNKWTFKNGDIEEVFDNVKTGGKTDAQLKEIFASSSLVVVSGAHATEPVVNTEDHKLTSGSDGSPAASDYKTAIENSNIRVSGKIFFTDNQTDGVRAALTTFVKTEGAGQCVIGPSTLSESAANAAVDAETYQDTDGRVIFVFNPIKFSNLGQIEEESPVFLAASILNLTPPHISPAAARTVAYTQTAVDTKFNLTRAQLIALRKAGVCAFENDADLGIKLVSDVTGSPAYSIQRRRMADFYINAVALFLKQFQSEPNSQLTRAQIRSAITNFDADLVANGVLPGDNEVAQGKAFLVKTEGITSPTEMAQGILKVELKRRLFAPAAFIVLIATIAESVEITEA